MGTFTQQKTLTSVFKMSFSGTIPPASGSTLYTVPGGKFAEFYIQNIERDTGQTILVGSFTANALAASEHTPFSENSTLIGAANAGGTVQVSGGGDYVINLLVKLYNEV